MDKSSLNKLLVLSHIFLLAVLALLIATHLPGFAILGIMALMIGFVLLFISRNLRKQYRLISTIADKISQGDHSLRIPDLELEEFNLLGQDLNTMLGSLDKTIHHLAIHREELRLVLGSIADPLWSQRQDGRIAWANSAFGELFPAYNPDVKQCLSDICPDKGLLRLIRDKDDASGERISQLEIEGHYYILTGNRNKTANRSVFLLQNIDTLKNTERMKKDFIVNLAHELRTPLTAIKGFSEAMEEHISEANLRYLKIIQNHTGRLIHLIKDLEQLIKLESLREIEPQEINLYTFFENLELILNPMVQDRNLALILTLSPDLPRFSCDPFKLEQVFINLVQNSLRYTDQGGITIKCSVDENQLLIEVADTGKGIEPLHLPRIFERFYVADPARNRQQSGTGLGLTIVKHIVLIHNGTIEAFSNPGEGTSFRISLPLQNPEL